MKNILRMPTRICEQISSLKKLTVYRTLLTDSLYLCLKQKVQHAAFRNSV